jgi:hypothetical protein
MMNERLLSELRSSFSVFKFFLSSEFWFRVYVWIRMINTVNVVNFGFLLQWMLL